MHSIDLALLSALLLTLGVVCQWIAWRMRLPAILPLLLAGIALGPGLGLLDPDQYLGELLFPVVSLGVAIILFEGSLTLRFSDIRNVKGIILNLTTIGVLVTWAVMAAAAHYLAGLSWELSLLFGALMTVTGPTVIMPMLRSIRPSARVANILRWEGILVDPIGAVLAVLIFEFINTGQESESIMEFGKVVMLGTVWGVAGGAALAQVLRLHLLPEYLKHYGSLAFVLLVFTISNSLGAESGLIAVTVMGMVLANSRDVAIDDLLSFKEHLTVVLISMLFILLAARLNIDEVMAIGTSAILILAVALFVARPLSVLLSSIGGSVKGREIALISWIAPRGIVAAAISSLFALKLEDKIPQAGVIIPLSFTLILGTVIVYGLTAGWLAQRLGLSSRGEQGVMLTSANRVSLLIGEALMRNDVKVLVADTRREGLQKARMAKMNVFYGDPLSEHADRQMDLTGYTTLMATSRNTEANAMVCARFRHEFGPQNVFSLRPTGPDESDQRKGLARGLRTNPLFGVDVSWSKLASMDAKGAKIKSTKITEDFGFDDFNAEQKDHVVNLFAFDESGKLQVFSSERHQLDPQPGWTVVSLSIDPEELKPEKNKADQA
ncbi:MAG TPA: sodium:proton antiporter [Xanthomonadales bacterium]|nr:sodium:proton antiporter [Xanthomonadales bacterium]